MAHSNCIVDRKVLVTRRMVAWGSGETIPGTESQYWEEREFGTPLFGDSESGVCRSCSSGWKVESNYPPATEKNKSLVPHYFTSEALEFRCGEGDNRCNCSGPEHCGYIEMGKELEKILNQ